MTPEEITPAFAAMGGVEPKLPAAVLFDMDGLLVETEDLWYAAETLLMAELGTVWGPEHQGTLVGGPLEFAVQYMIEVTGADHDHAVVLQRLIVLMEAQLRSNPVHWRPGARELVEALNAASVPCALVSASWRVLIDAVHDAVLHELGHEVFATTVAGDELERTKPHPDPYLLAALRMGVDPAHCIVLEDSHTGARSGVAAGAFVVAVPSVVDIELAHGLHVVRSLEGLTPAILGDWSHDWSPR
ncbi:MAG: HAD family hydrolase [Actinomycetes bacterium]